MSTNQKIRSLQLFNVIGLLIGLVYIGVTGEFFWLLVSYFIFVLMCPIGISTGLHRLLSHRSFETKSYIEKIIITLSVFATVGSPTAWVAIHRTHHGFTDTDNDPHSPYDNEKITFKKIVTVCTGFGQKDYKIPISYVKDVIRDPYYKWLNEHYFKILITCITVLLLINPVFLLFLYCIPATISLQTTSIVNIFGHYYGYRLYDTNDKSTNSWIVNIISLGEGNHNTHHKFPTRYHLSEKWYDFDLIGQFIKIIKIR